jgi:hypothetical protein
LSPMMTSDLIAAAVGTATTNRPVTRVRWLRRPVAHAAYGLTPDDGREAMDMSVTTDPAETWSWSGV